MMWIIWIAGVLVMGTLLVVFSDIKLKIRFSRTEHDDAIETDVRALYGLIRFRYAVPIIYWQDGLRLKREQVNRNDKQLLKDDTITIDREQIERYFLKVKMVLANTARLVEWTKGVMAKTVCTDLTWITRVGVGDAADTAITTGAVWGLKSSLLGFMSRYVRLKAQPVLSVQPQFNRMLFNTEAECRLKIKAGFAIVAGFILLRRILQVKGGLSKWRKLLFKPSRT